MAMKKKKETPIERYVKNWRKGLSPKTKKEAKFREQAFKSKWI